MSNTGPAIPTEGRAHAELLEEMRAWRSEDVRWDEHRAFSLVFHHSDEHTDFLKQAHNLFFEGNGLNPMAFASLRRFEHDVVRMTARLLNGGADAVGTMSTGGTESIMLAMRTYRDRARKLKPWVKQPEVVLPESAHIAFLKAGKYFDVRMVTAPLEKDGRVNINAVRRRINPDTIALVGSAPNYPNGAIDPMEELGALALDHGLPLHVDACVGGFFLPWAERLGYDIPPWDFRVPGVTSISADLHKYGYAAKGASTITYRSMDYLRHQFYVHVNWPGGVFASPSMPGTRPGGTIAAAWAALQAMGESGYLESTRQTLAVAERFREGIRAIDGLEIVGAPPVGLMAYRSAHKALNIYAVADVLAQRGWHVDRQQKPASIHLMLNPGHAFIVGQYLADLEEAVAYVRAHPKSAVAGSAPAYGLMAGAPMRGMVEKNVRAAMERMFSPEGATPSFDAKDGGVPRPVLALMKLKRAVTDIFRKG